MAKPVRVAPSILAADFARLGEEAEAAVAAGADWLHFDVMDGHFVPNISFGPAIIGALRPRVQTSFDIHLMIEPVDPFLPAVAAAGADHITLHAEAGPHLDRSLREIRRLGCRAGAALCPATPVSAIEHVLDTLDIILIMTVNPGFGGQAFLPSMVAKVGQARALAGDRPIDIIVDGGITPDTAPPCVAAGADVLVAGSSVFRGDYAANIMALRPVAG